MGEGVCDSGRGIKYGAGDGLSVVNLAVCRIGMVSKVWLVCW